jgi:hypothetical protein
MLVFGLILALLISFTDWKNSMVLHLHLTGIRQFPNPERTKLYREFHMAPLLTGRASRRQSSPVLCAGTEPTCIKTAGPAPTVTLTSIYPFAITAR